MAVSRMLWSLATTAPLVVMFEKYVLGFDTIEADTETNESGSFPRKGDVVLSHRWHALTKLAAGRMLTFKNTESNAIMAGRVVGLQLEYIIWGGMPFMSQLLMIPRHHVCVSLGDHESNTHMYVHEALLRGVPAAIVWPLERVKLLPDAFLEQRSLQ